MSGIRPNWLSPGDRRTIKLILSKLFQKEKAWSENIKFNWMRDLTIFVIFSSILVSGFECKKQMGKHRTNSTDLYVYWKQMWDLRLGDITDELGQRVQHIAFNPIIDHLQSYHVHVSSTRTILKVFIGYNRYSITQKGADYQFNRLFIWLDLRWPSATKV